MSEAQTVAKNTRTLVGKVVSDKRAKTVTVLVERRTAHKVCHATTHFELGENDVVNADLLQDLAVSSRVSLSPNLLQAQLKKQRGSEDAGLEVGTDGDHRAVHVGKTELL